MRDARPHGSLQGRPRDLPGGAANLATMIDPGGLDNFRSRFGVVPQIGKECLLP